MESGPKEFFPLLNLFIYFFILKIITITKLNVKKILAVINATYAVAKKEA